MRWVPRQLVISRRLAECCASDSGANRPPENCSHAVTRHLNKTIKASFLTSLFEPLVQRFESVTVERGGRFAACHARRLRLMVQHRLRLLQTAG